MKLLQKISLSLAFLVFNQSIAFADAVPDRSLGRERSRVERGNVNGLPSEVVSGGARRGRALFHSFRRLSVADGQGLYFQSPDGVSNILTRVTGRESSRISGSLGVLGGANLVLLNPNGIRFGRRATLDLRGSFLATTATSLDFGAYRFASHRPVSVPPLLTIDLPTGLNFDRAGQLVVRGTGHQIDFVGPSPLRLLNPLSGAGQSSTGLRVSPGQTLALLGAEVMLDGAVLSAPSGSIELAALSDGQAQVVQGADGWRFSYAPTALGDIQMRRLALLDVSGLGGGRLGLSGDRISLSGSSYGINQNVGLTAGQTMTIRANSLRITGSRAAPSGQTFRFSQSRSGFLSNTFLADGSDIRVDVGDLTLDSGGIIRTFTFGSGRSGDITVRSRGDLSLSNFSSLDGQTGLSAIQSFTAASGQGGDINLSTRNLSLTNGGGILAATVSPAIGAGRSGEITIRSDNIEVDGITTPFNVLSSISTTSSGVGNAGNIRIDADSAVSITRGGSVGTISLGVGRAGNFQINARDIFISNGDATSRFSGLFASAITSPDLERLLQLSGSPSGNAGSLSVNADTIRLQDRGLISVTNSGRRAGGGSLVINAGAVVVDRSSAISAATNGGQGGNIRLNVDSLVLRDRSVVDANARRRSAGGNIEIESDTVALLNSSQIRANAQEGRGGNISIDADGLFVSPGSAITATSERSREFDGSIVINAFEVGARQSELNVEEASALPQVSSVCQAQASDTESQFIISGTGGFPSSPFDSFDGSSGWVDPTASPAASESVSLPDLNTPKPPPVEAQGWQRNPDGTLRLVSIIANANVAATGAEQLNCNSQR
ncbi:filamentous hemagglutinin N-terminal domain-containing protein [Rivularia sp. UHCC 0363]|uniref:two-partner secretion domain-containing protein n=1 Tax=Rivularia sp. UHCC 0363 TaxID=3110244 RepID=UPI002B1F4A4E|nr:filamentous hemagglutinin N-terminal domain-containing protein [Rivularia sp. UHCC 0363]MEA5599132.1 filamentous hemagglutinin N-terminal domain-containing protein [Rivularia sp. UHCC 0363]